MGEREREGGVGKVERQSIYPVRHIQLRIHTDKRISTEIRKLPQRFFKTFFLSIKTDGTGE